MAWVARWSLRRDNLTLSLPLAVSLNGLGGSLELETAKTLSIQPTTKSLNGLGGSLELETDGVTVGVAHQKRLNGLGGSLELETESCLATSLILTPV